MNEQRPSPEEMLELAAQESAQEQRGRLKIFFGAAPGVGKTYAMLEQAQLRKLEGADVVIGWVEPHGRVETEVLMAGIERLAPRIFQYRGLTLREFDLDAALERRPGLLLLDELAHSNAPGSRHARRWQDVEELLEAGISVATTLNVQHVESLNDVVAQITGMQVRETVPDSVLDRADEIEVVDLPPEDLIRRLKEGKVYIPVQAERALRQFFKKGNLYALRELSLRRVAERVNADVAKWRREHGIERPWPTRERILVAVSSAPQAADLVRAAYRMADRLQAPWIALSVETPRFTRYSAQDHQRVGSHLELARRLGAETVVVRGEKLSEEILALARERNVTRVIIGKPTHPRWRDRLRGSLVEQLARDSAGVDILITTGDAGERESAPAAAPRRRAPLHGYAAALAVVAACTGLGLLGRPVFTVADQSMLFLLGIVAVAGFWDRGPSLLAAAASVAALDFFFVPPFHTFAVAEFQYILTFCVLMATGVLVSALTVRVREQAGGAQERERRTAALYALSRELVAETSAGAIAAAALRHLRRLVPGGAALFLVEDGDLLAPCPGSAPELAASEHEIAVARWVLANGRPAGHGTATLPRAAGLYLPLPGAERVLGVAGFVPGGASEPMSPAQRQLLETFVSHTAVALERALLTEAAEQARLAAETEHARSDLLSAVSHDLRTPLASITGSASALLDGATALDEGRRRELLETIRDESDRLGRLVGDLLELTRLESGALRARKEWYPVEELVSSALGRMSERLEERPVEVELPEEVMLAPMDPVLMEQVLLNLLENAVKYSPRSSSIEIAARREPDAVVITVADRGLGVPPGEEQRIFERFYRVGDGGGVEGTGLGLAVCRAAVQAHGGSIAARPRPGGGALFEVRLPAAGEAPAAEPPPLMEEGRP